MFYARHIKTGHTKHNIYNECTEIYQRNWNERNVRMRAINHFIHIYLHIHTREYLRNLFILLVLACDRSVYAMPGMVFLFFLFLTKRINMRKISDNNYPQNQWRHHTFFSATYKHCIATLHGKICISIKCDVYDPATLHCKHDICIESDY